MCYHYQCIIILNDLYRVLLHQVIYTYDYQLGEFVPTQVQGLSPVPGQVVDADTRSVMPFRTKDDQLFLAVANFNPLYNKGYNLFKVCIYIRDILLEEPLIG